MIQVWPVEKTWNVLILILMTVRVVHLCNGARYVHLEFKQSTFYCLYVNNVCIARLLNLNVQKGKSLRRGVASAAMMAAIQTNQKGIPFLMLENQHTPAIMYVSPTSCLQKHEF